MFHAKTFRAIMHSSDDVSQNLVDLETQVEEYLNDFAVPSIRSVTQSSDENYFVITVIIEA